MCPIWRIARLWWRVCSALLFVQVVQAVLIQIGVELLRHTDWLGGATSDLVSGLLLVTLLYLLVKLPFAAYQWAFRQQLGQSAPVRTEISSELRQDLGQLPRDLREAISSNARSRAVFQCGQDDAAYLAREFAPLDAAALMSLPRFEMAARLSIGGHTSAPFTLRTLPPSELTDPLPAAEVVAASLSRYGRQVDVIDRELQVTLAPPGDAQIPAVRIGWTP